MSPETPVVEDKTQDSNEKKKKKNTTQFPLPNPTNTDTNKLVQKINISIMFCFPFIEGQVLKPSCTLTRLESENGLCMNACISMQFCKSRK